MSTGAPKKVYFVGGPLESQKIMANVRKCRKTLSNYIVPGKVFKSFLRTDMDSAHVRVPYRPLFVKKLKNFAKSKFIPNFETQNLLKYLKIHNSPKIDPFETF